MYLREVDEQILGMGAGGVAGAALGAYMARRKNSRFERKKTQRDRLMKYVGVGGIAGAAVGSSLGSAYKKYTNGKRAFEDALSGIEQDMKDAARKARERSRAENAQHTFKVTSKDLGTANKFIEMICYKYAEMIATETDYTEVIKRMHELDDKIMIFLDKSFNYGKRKKEHGLQMLATTLITITSQLSSQLFDYAMLLQAEQIGRSITIPENYKAKYIKLFKKEYPKIVKASLRLIAESYNKEMQNDESEFPFKASVRFLTSFRYKNTIEHNKLQLAKVTRDTLYY